MNTDIHMHANFSNTHIASWKKMKKLKKKNNTLVCIKKL